MDLNKKTKKSSTNLLKKRLFLMGVFVLIICIALGIYYIHGNNLSKKQVYSIKQEIEGIESDIDENILGKYASEYQECIDEYKEALENENLEILNQVYYKIMQIHDNVNNENLRDLTTLTEELRNTDLSLLDQNDKDEINIEIGTIEELVNNKKYRTAKSSIMSLQENISSKNENIKKLKTQDKYEKLNGYWIPNNLESFPYRINIKNKNIVQAFIGSETFVHPISKWIFNENNNTFNIDCDWGTPNPISGIKVYSFAINVIDDKNVKIDNVPYRKVSYTDASLYYEYAEYNNGGMDYTSIANLWDRVNPAFLDEDKKTSSYTKEQAYQDIVKNRDLFDEGVKSQISKAENIDSNFIGFSVSLSDYHEEIPGVAAYNYSILHTYPIMDDGGIAKISKAGTRYGVVLENGVIKGATPNWVIEEHLKSLVK